MESRGSLRSPSIIQTCFLLLLALTSTVTAQFTFLYTVCGNDSYPPNGAYQSNLNQILKAMSSDTRITNGFYNFTAGQPPNRASSIAICRGDVPLGTCRQCINNSATILPGACPGKIEAFGYSQYCSIFVSNNITYGTIQDYPMLQFRDQGNVSDASGFNTSLQVLLNTLIDDASSGDSDTKYATGQVDIIGKGGKLYGLVQCTPDLDKTSCAECIEEALIILPDCCLQPNFTFSGVRVVSPSCFLQYDVFPFFSSPPSPPRGNPSYAASCWGVSYSECINCFRNARKLLPFSHDGHVSLPHCTVQDSHTAISSNASHATPGITPSGASKPPKPSRGRDAPPIFASSQGDARNRKVLSISLSLSASLLIIVFLVLCFWRRQHKSKPTETQSLNIDDITTLESLQFDMNTIKRATCNFSIANKLGKGGFGEVYKGVLEDGQEIAVKRLSKTSGQGITEFKTEVLLVAKLQHKNLVKLLGFCFVSNEKILVYEYLQNSSLDKFLLDSIKKSSFDWKMRFNVIVGIAKGLLYLHEDSRFKIIHRDLKPSNILLDNHMTPKISDFGLARLFEAGETEGDTKRIVGTYGYMAPEYAMTGHFSVKSDVYSFGIIVLEIVSGQKHKLLGPRGLEEALLHRAWRLWNEMNSLDLVDSSLGNEYPKEEAKKCIHIGLLCIQESETERPRMTTVVAALNGQLVSLPMPKAPNFFGTNGVNMNMTSAQYGKPTNGNEIEYRHISDQNGCPHMYSGTQHITGIYPR